MNEEVIVAVYDTVAHADAAVRDLQAANVPANAISRQGSGSTATGAATGTATGTLTDTSAMTGTAPMAGTTGSDSTTSVRAPGQGFWASLFGGEPDNDTAVYDRSIEAGSSVVTVRVPGEHVQAVTEILDRHNPIDLDERASSYGLTSGGTTTTATTTTTTAAMPTTAATPTEAAPPRAQSTELRGGEEVIPLSEEQMKVGKRLVNRGTTRIRRFVVETPVEENVALHSERVVVERRPVELGTRVSDADFTDRVIEVTETDEEAVVSKTARVKEEVVVNKNVSDRVETVRDTVRREEVEVARDDKTVARDDKTVSPGGTTTPTSPRRR